MNKKIGSILFELIITNQCNKRCEYCNLNFNNKKISDKVISNFINFILSNYLKFNNIKINFFGGEPLLEKKIIIKVVEKLKKLDNIDFMIGTNGLLVNKKFLDFSLKNNIHYYLTIDTDKGEEILEKKIFKNYLDLIEVNFVINPNSINKGKYTFDKIINYGYKKINIMPVFGVNNWVKEKLIELLKLINYINNSNKQIQVKKFNYFNGLTSDIQFVLETNGNIYRDVDSLLWIQKQNNNISDKLKYDIEKNTLVGNILKKKDLNLFEDYPIKDLISFIFKIPKEQNLIKTYKVIEKILN